MKKYRTNFLNDWDQQGGLIRQIDAANLLQWSRQRMNGRIQRGTVKSFEYEHKGERIVFVSLNEIKKIAIQEAQEPQETQEQKE